MIEVTRDILMECWDTLAKHYGSRVVDKSSAEEMQLVSEFLDRVGILDSKSFMSRYTTTIQNVIYTPFVLGDSSTMQLYRQLHICLHEHQHVHQWNVGQGDFILEYVLDSDKRAAYEVEAMRANMELDHLFGRHPRTIEAWTRKLKDYALHDLYIATVNKMLNMARQSVNAGGIETDVGRIAIPLLRRLTG